MFIREKELQRKIDYLEEEIKRISDKYWDLYKKYHRLRNNLGLKEEIILEDSIIKEIE